MFYILYPVGPSKVHELPCSQANIAEPELGTAQPQSPLSWAELALLLIPLATHPPARPPARLPALP